MPNRVHHESLWIFDGNIILSVPSAVKDHDVLFKVHKSVLTRESIVFSDMFSFPDPDPSVATSEATEMYESLPLVHLHDNAEEWEKLLNILYKPMEFRLNKYDPDVPDFVDGVLQLTTKYQMDAIRGRIVEHIEADWPSNIAEWDDFQSMIEDTEIKVASIHDQPPEHRLKVDMILPEPVAAIQIARRHNIPSILPAALYHLTNINPQANYDTVRRDGYSQYGVIIVTARWSRVTAEDRLQMETALTEMCQYVHRECSTLSNYFLPFGFDLGEPTVVTGCTSEAVCCSNFERLMRSVVLAVHYTRSPLFVLKCKADAGMLATEYPLCEECFSARAPEETFLEIRSKLWTKLPEFFGLTAEPQE